MDYDVLYRCLFPSIDAIDGDEYMPLFTREFIEAHITDNSYLYGNKLLGVDISYSGADENCFVLRGDNIARLLKRDHNNKPTETIQNIILFMEDYGISDRNVYLDSTAGGNAFLDTIKEKGYVSVHGINFGEKSINEEKYANKKAEGYFKLKEWLSRGGINWN